MVALQPGTQASPVAACWLIAEFPRDRREARRVLQRVRPGVPVARVVGRLPVRRQIDPRRGIGGDGVVADRVPFTRQNGDGRPAVLAQGVVLDPVAPRAGDHDGSPLEPLDREAADDALARFDPQARGRASRAPVQRDHGRAVAGIRQAPSGECSAGGLDGSRLAEPVEGHRVADGGKRRGGADDVRSAQVDREPDRVGARIRVRVEDRLPERSRPLVARAVHHEDRSPRGQVRGRIGPTRRARSDRWRSARERPPAPGTSPTGTLESAFST